MAAEHHIPVTRTARYYTLGELNENTRDIWIVIHGRKYLAGKFILSFDELTREKSFVVAPEGLMRFYLKGDYGEVGASWMTKEDRETDIKDYVNYLDRLFFDEIEPKAKLHSLKINALGFSQGVATLSRWLSLGKAKVDKTVFWCGSLAHDVDFSKAENLKKTQIYQIFASDDPYFKERSFPKEQLEILSKAGIASQTHTFKGGHEINFRLIKEAGIL
jgi:predicted esterase